MPVELGIDVNEKSSVLITAAFTDETGASAAPNSILWTLTDKTGTAIINGRERVSVTPAAVVKVLLKGDDLAIEAPKDTIRLFTLEYTYDSSNGSDIPAKEEVSFTVKNLKYIA